MDQAGQLLGHTVNFPECLAGIVGKGGTLNHSLRGPLHGRDGVVCIGLDRLDQGRDLFGGFGGALRQTLHFFGHHGKTTACLACRSRLNGGIQGQHVGLFGNVGDELGDFADFL